MDYKLVLYEKEGAVVRITFNQPEKLNAFDFPGQGGILDDFYAALQEAEDDDEIKVIVLRGAGRSFCSGVRCPNRTEVLVQGPVFGSSLQGNFFLDFLTDSIFVSYLGSICLFQTPNLLSIFPKVFWT